MKITAKIKRFKVARIPVEIETKRPAAVRLYLLAHMYKLIKYKRVRIFIGDEQICTVYRLYIPSIEVMKNDGR